MTETARVRVFPSILSADFGRLGEEVVRAERAGADGFHVDVMDGRFVPNISVGPYAVRAVRAATRLPVDVHLMIVEPERYLDTFLQAGADAISVHAEATPHVARALQHIREAGRKAGLALNPQTSHEAVRYLVDLADYVLIMSVNPGFGGQKFMPQVLPKIRAVRELAQASGKDLLIEVDGGMQPGTARLVVEAGARRIVAGTAVYTRPDYAAAIAEIRDDGMKGLPTSSGTE